MQERTHKTAVVTIPPETAWEPIQRIRRDHDRQYRRWMPHITMLYPFRPAKEFDDLAGPLAEACQAMQPFEVELGEFRWFSHGRRSFTVWLSPQPAESLQKLQAAIRAVAPDCDDVARHAGGFTPHLSVGQAGSREELEALVELFGKGWQPVRFRVQEIHMIRRGDPPDDVFQVDRSIPLGA